MNISDELTATGFLKKLVGFSMATWMSAMISFLITPVFTRVYLPEEVGHINLFTTYVTFFQTICLLALDQAFMRFYNETLNGLHKGNFLSYCLRINLGLIIPTVIIILGGYRFFSCQISGEENLLVPICLSSVVVCGTFLKMSNISSRMEKNIVQYTLQVVSTVTVEKILITFIAFWRPDHKTAIVTMTMGYVIVSSIFYLVKKNGLQSAKDIPAKTKYTILKFAIPYMPVLLLSWLGNSIPLLVLRKYVGYSSIGIYTNAVTMANVLHIIQTGFSVYWEPFVYEHYKDRTNKEKIQKIEKTMVFILNFAAVSIVICQDVIFLLVGKQFQSSKLFFPFLMLTPICNTIADMTGIGIKLSGKSYLNIIPFIGGVLCNLGLSYFLVPQIGLIGAGVAVGTSALLILIVRSRLGRNHYKVSENEWFIVLALVLMVSTCIINIVLNGSWLKYILQIGVLGILSLAFKKEIIYLLKLAKRILKVRDK